jgi:hypothetical protein
MVKCDDDSEDDDDEPPPKPMDIPMPSQASANLAKLVMMPNAATISSMTASHLAPLAVNAAMNGNMGAINAVTSMVGVHSSDQSFDPRISAERSRRWEILLVKRPVNRDDKSMPGWLMEVLAVSDLDQPLKPLEEFMSALAALSADAPFDGDLGPPLIAAGGDGTPVVPDEASSPVLSGKNSSKEKTGEVTNGALPSKNKKGSDGKPAKVSTPPTSVGDILKNKRPLPNNDSKSGIDGSPKKEDAARDGSNGTSAASSEPFSSGSFAEWKERKKQKKALLKESTSPNTTPQTE